MDTEYLQKHKGCNYGFCKICRRCKRKHNGGCVCKKVSPVPIATLPPRDKRKSENKIGIAFENKKLKGIGMDRKLGMQTDTCHGLLPKEDKPDAILKAVGIPKQYNLPSKESRAMIAEKKGKS